MSFHQSKLRAATAVMVLVGAVIGPCPRAAHAASGDVQIPPGKIITDVKVITGSAFDIRCPAGYYQRWTNLNEGSGGDYVYACLGVGSFNDPASGIDELYINEPYYPDPTCLGDDTAVDGDLNSGVVNGLFGDEVHEALQFCAHRPGTYGGSGLIYDPGAVHPTYFSPRVGKVLRDLQFVVFAKGSLPQCVNTACADTGAGIFSYLEYGVTAEPYCQSLFGPEYHPIFYPWQYIYSSQDQYTDVPQDSGVSNLNAGSILKGAPLIYACGAYVAATGDSIAPTITTSATTPEGQPYTPGTWTNQPVTINWSCEDDPGGVGVAYVTPAITDYATSAGAPMYYSDAVCTDYVGNTTYSTSFGPIMIDRTPPVLAVDVRTADGEPYVPNQWADQDVIVSFSCTESAPEPGSTFYSGLDDSKSNPPPPIVLSSDGWEQTVVQDSTGACTDNAGNVSSGTVGLANIFIAKSPDTVRAYECLPPLEATKSAYAEAVLAASPLAYYRFDDPCLSSIADSSGHDVGAQAFGGVDLHAAGAVNDGDAGLSFDGSSGYVSLGDPASLQPDQVSLEAWINTTRLAYQTIVRKRTFGYGMAVDDTGKPIFGMNDAAGAGYTVTGPASVADGSWHHLVGTYDGGHVCLYVDGAPAGACQAAGAIHYEPDLVAIGRDGGAPTTYFAGRIDDVAIYGAALTPAQVRWHHGAATQTPTTINDTDGAISYRGSWAYYGGLPADEIGHDLHATAQNGDRVTYTFFGTGASYLTQRSTDGGEVDAYVDGAYQETVSTFDASFATRERVYAVGGLPAGVHTLELVKQGGSLMEVDGFEAFAVGKAINDTDPGITYGGTSWRYSPGRDLGDYMNDEHYATAAGEYVSYTFTGTGITLIGEKNGGGGNQHVYLDEVDKGTVSTYDATTRRVAQVLYTVSGLPMGTHTLRVVKGICPYLEVDAFLVIQTALL